MKTGESRGNPAPRQTGSKWQTETDSAKKVKSLKMLTGFIFPPSPGIVGSWALLTGLWEDSWGEEAPKKSPGLPKGEGGKSKICSAGLRPRHAQTSGRAGSQAALCCETETMLGSSPSPPLLYALFATGNCSGFSSVSQHPSSPCLCHFTSPGPSIPLL